MTQKPLAEQSWQSKERAGLRHVVGAGKLHVRAVQTRAGGEQSLQHPCRRVAQRRLAIGQ